MSEAVLDAGPLIHLAELEALDTLMDFSVLFVPLAVRQEVERYQPSALSIQILCFRTSLHRFRPHPFWRWVAPCLWIKVRWKL